MGRRRAASEIAAWILGFGVDWVRGPAFADLDGNPTPPLILPLPTRFDNSSALQHSVRRLPPLQYMAEE